MSNKRTKIFSIFSWISIALFLIIGATHLATDISPEFADLVNSTASQGFRRIMASVGEIVSFSLFELLIICIPIILFFVIRKAVKMFSSREGRARFVVNLAAVVLLIYSGHLLALGVAHNTTTISRKMGIDEVEVTEENLIATLTDICDEINELATCVPRDSDGVFTHGYSYSEISHSISRDYITFADAYNLPEGYYSTAKGVRVSEVMSYLGITGIYTYVTGEANVNTQYPDYVTLFTIAHEMSHQRGILRENEANFVAYILLSSSDDPCFRYSAEMNMYNYFASALYSTNKDAYYEIVAELSPLAKADIRVANAVSQKYGDTIIEKISEWINDFYLKSSGSGGIVSYSCVVELVLSYREGKK
ncbi:MAG: DUF3810 domain-containing protein [Clostridia bacterium]|nr:DUF3810 domain-containing protein [Clostridia bacterium]